MTTRRTLLGAGLATPFILSSMAHAQGSSQTGGEAYPNQPIRLVCPYPPGATSDNVTRVMARALSARLGQTVVVDNRAGAGGAVGTRHVADSRADGYTLLTASGGNLLISPYLSDVGYDPLRSLAPVAMAGEAYSLVGISAALPVKTLPELIAYAKQHQGELNYASSGIGSTGHLRGALLAEAAGFEAVHIPFPGSAAAVNSVLAGDCQILIDPVVAPHVQGGKIRPLAVVGTGRWEDFPDVPNVTELGIGQEWPSSGWYSLFAPAGVPQSVIARLNAAYNDALADPEIALALRRLGLKPEPVEPGQLRQRLAREYAASGVTLQRLRITA
ncbi:Bug family tripartite tricarboxylate transporter substrate binding protein [Pseudoroseomonas globiformis]|uniref:Bug family tripartite tricarboxylate transporter substrate binding protein n=1 Tax=Teichococcus globiformis TaxID=2307229 RepID=A0ABV7G441_9PROT